MGGFFIMRTYSILDWSSLYVMRILLLMERNLSVYTFQQEEQEQDYLTLKTLVVLPF